MNEKLISRREALKRIFGIALGLGFVSFFARNVFADIVFRGKDGTGITEFIYYNESTGLTTIGKAGDIELGDGTERDMFPNTDAKINLGTSSKNFNDIFMKGKFITGAQTELTISSGAVVATKSYHSIDTEGGGGSDNLDTISGGVEGMILVIRANNSARSVVAKDNVDNLQLAGDFTMDNVEDTLTLIYDGSNWLEISRSDNGA